MTSRLGGGSVIGYAIVFKEDNCTKCYPNYGLIYCEYIRILTSFKQTFQTSKHIVSHKFLVTIKTFGAKV